MERYWELKKILPNPETQEVVNEFLLSCKLSNLSEKTIINYRRYMEQFFADFEDPYSSLSPEQILSWLKENKSHLKESSYKTFLSAISSFYNFCVYETLLEHSPIKKRWFPRLPKGLPKYLEKGDIAKVRRASEQSFLRNQALVEFMLTSGCRVSEVHRLNLEDVDFENRTARVLGKGKKFRHVHFSERCLVLLEQYVESRENVNSRALFITLKVGRRLSMHRICKIIYEIGDQSNLSTKLHPHRLRHTFATELLAKGADLSFIGDELGHANLNTTQIYARLLNDQIIAQYRKFMG